MTTPSELRPADEAWARWGWLMGGIWLFFFGFPLWHLWTADYPESVRLGGTGLVIAFAATYIAALRMSTMRVARAEYASAQRIGLTGLACLLLIWLALGLLIGPQSMTAMPFVVSMSVFFLPWRWVWFTTIPLFVGAVLVSFFSWGIGTSFLWGITFFVLMLSVLSRYMEERQDEARETSSRLALTEERERVARDVHDVLGHSLTVVTMKTELAERLIDVDPERAKAELAEVQSLSRQALAEIRATVGGLRVARLADEVEAAGMALRGAGIEAHLPEDLAVVDPRHRITLAWVLREAVTNVVRHSRASTCVVEVGSDWLHVTDDGRGLGGRREGNGLRGLRERVEQAGGMLTVGPGTDGAGTRLEVKL